MALKFNPQATNESAQSKEILPEGIYKFKVMSAKEKKSQSGNPMVQTELLIHNKNNSGAVKDYLGAWAYGEVKILGFLDAVGLPTIGGELHPNQIVNRQGYLKLTIKESTNPKYPGPQNNVARYYTANDLVAEGILKVAAPIANPEPPAPTKPEPILPVGAPVFTDDDLPF